VDGVLGVRVQPELGSSSRSRSQLDADRGQRRQEDHRDQQRVDDRQRADEPGQGDGRLPDGQGADDQPVRGVLAGLVRQPQRVPERRVLEAAQPARAR
jgi:hypothetical protein